MTYARFTTAIVGLATLISYAKVCVADWEDHATFIDSPAYTIACDAANTLRKALITHQNDERQFNLHGTYKGSYRYVGNFNAPDAVTKYELSGEVEWNQYTNVWNERQVSTRSDGRSQTQTIQTTIDGSIAQQTTNNQLKPSPLDTETRNETLIDMQWLMPLAVLQRVSESQSNIRYAEITFQGSPAYLLTFVDIDNNMRDCIIDATSYELRAVHVLGSYKGLGDSLQAIEYDKYHMIEGMLLPSVISIQRSRANSTTYSTVEIEWEVTPVGADSSVADEQVDDTVAVYDLSPGIVAIELEDKNTRSLLVEFEDHIIMLEAPVDAQTTQRILEAARRYIPNKPVRAMAVSHHHRHYIGGIRTFVAQDIPIYAAPQTGKLLQRIVAWPHSYDPDVQSKLKKTALLKFVDGELLLEDTTNRLEIYDIGSASNHTDEYLVFYFPKAKLLFVGDLVSMSNDDEQLRIGSWAKGLYAALSERGLEVETIVYSWPVRNHQRKIHFDLLREAINRERE